jgi:hypothetical protein
LARFKEVQYLVSYYKNTDVKVDELVGKRKTLLDNLISLLLKMTLYLLQSTR